MTKTIDHLFYQTFAVVYQIKARSSVFYSVVFAFWTSWRDRRCGSSNSQHLSLATLEMESGAGRSLHPPFFFFSQALRILDRSEGFKLLPWICQ
jgi:hypothetical protein